MQFGVVSARTAPQEIEFQPEKAQNFISFRAHNHAPSKTASKASLFALNRNRVLTHTMQLIQRAWASFDRPHPVQPTVSMNVRTLLSMSLPSKGTDPIAVLNEADEILTQSLSQPRPGFLAFVGSSGLEIGVLADTLATSHDVNLATYSGAASLLEKQALQWIGELIGYPGRHGTFTSGGMLSNLTALTAARQRAFPNCRVEGVQLDVAVYVSCDAHSSIERAVEILGLGSRSLRNIPLNCQRQMDVTALRATIEQDLAAGVVPVAIVATAGTTLAGVVDPLAEIAEIANAYNIWLHVDGAYGLPAAALPTMRRHFAGLEQADSVTVDAHKWLFVPKACGVLLVKDQAALRATFGHDAAYMPTAPEESNPVEWTLEYSRPLRALKIWMGLRAHGASSFRDAIQRNLAQAKLCAHLVKRSPHLELLQEPQLSVVLFRRIPNQGNVNQHNQHLAQAIQEDGRFYIVGAKVDGKDWLRVCFVNYRTDDDDVRSLVDVVEEIGASIESC